MHIQDLAARLNAHLADDVDLDIQGVAPMDEAGPHDVTFLANPKYSTKLETCRAGAILVSSKFTGTPPMAVLKVAHPYLAFAQAIELFYSKPQPQRSVHPTAIIGEGVTLGQNLAIGPYVVIGNGVTIGDDVTIYAHCMIYDGVTIGAGSTLHSHVVIREAVQLGERVMVQNSTVIGADGFGFVPMADGSFYKIMQAGTVVIGDDVEVQALSAIDRASIGTTKIGHGCKIDNLVQVGHGCKIGNNTLLCGQVGLAGSTTIGNNVILAGRAGAVGHLTIGDRVMAGAGAVILQSVPAGTQVGGFPAMDQKQWLRVMAELKKLPDTLHRLRQVERASSQTNAKTPPLGSTS